MSKRGPFKYFKTSPDIIRLAVKAYSNWCWRVDEVFVKINGEQRRLCPRRNFKLNRTAAPEERRLLCAA